MRRQSINAVGRISREQQEETLEEHETKLSDFFKTQRKGRIAGWQQIQNRNAFKEIYEELDCSLGCGSYGEVKMCRHRISGVICAVKIVSKKFLANIGACAMENMRQELITLQTVDHQYCTRILQLLESEFNIYIVMEYIARGDLQKFII